MRGTRHVGRRHRRWAILVSAGVVLAACGADGPDANSADDLGIEVISGGDDMHAEHMNEPDSGSTGDESAAPSDEDADGDMGDHSGMGTDEVSDSGTAESGMAVPGADDVDEMVEEHEEMVDEHDGMADEHDGMSTDASDDEGTMADEGFVVEVEMVEFGFVADLGELPMGEAITFRFVNTGVVPHEAMFGSRHQQEEFATSAGHGDHGEAGHHGEVAAITLDPGAIGDITLEFSEAGEVWIGCHLPGHYDAGMVATFVVA